MPPVSSHRQERRKTAVVVPSSRPLYEAMGLIEDPVASEKEPTSEERLLAEALSWLVAAIEGSDEVTPQTTTNLKMRNAKDILNRMLHQRFGGSATRSRYSFNELKSFYKDLLHGLSGYLDEGRSLQFLLNRVKQQQAYFIELTEAFIIEVCLLVRCRLNRENPEPEPEHVVPLKRRRLRSQSQTQAFQELVTSATEAPQTFRRRRCRRPPVTEEPEKILTPLQDRPVQQPLVKKVKEEQPEKLDEPPAVEESRELDEEQAPVPQEKCGGCGNLTDVTDVLEEDGVRICSSCQQTKHPMIWALARIMLQNRLAVATRGRPVTAVVGGA